MVSYGLTGSGKSHTLFGKSGGDGVIISAIDDIFATAKKRAKKWDCKITASMLELHDDKLTDLFATSEKKLVVKKDVKGLVHVVNAVFNAVESSDDLSKAVSNGLKKRDELGHKAENSNVFVAIVVESSNKETGIINTGRIVFSDLVGCNKGNAAIDAVQNVVNALGAEEQEIPYTSCTLSKMLSDCLGGNAKTLVLVHVKPDEKFWEDTKQVEARRFKTKRIVFCRLWNWV